MTLLLYRSQELVSHGCSKHAIPVWPGHRVDQCAGTADGSGGGCGGEIYIDAIIHMFWTVYVV